MMRRGRRPSAGGTVRRPSPARKLWLSLLVLGVLAGGLSLIRAEEPLRLSRNLPGDSKQILVDADEVATWVEGKQRIILLKGQVLVQHGIAQVRCDQAVARIDLDRFEPPPPDPPPSSTPMAPLPELPPFPPDPGSSGIAPSTPGPPGPSPPGDAGPPDPPPPTHTLGPSATVPPIPGQPILAPATPERQF